MHFVVLTACKPIVPALLYVESSGEISKLHFLFSLPNFTGLRVKIRLFTYRKWNGVGRSVFSGGQDHGESGPNMSERAV